MRRKPFWMRTVSLITAVLLALPLPALSQNGATPSSPEAAPQRQFTQEELAQLVAPIALYPDELVAQILMASTYPLEVVEADRWVQQNRDLKGDPLARDLEQKNWDPSVKSLVNFPSVLSMMSQKLEVTAKLGDAFLNQEQEVMATIQSLRKKAYANGTLTATPEQKVIVEKETIVIQPANPEVVYVPAYDPFFVYGPWLYPAYPPYPYYAYPPPAYGVFAFGVGVTIGFAWGYAWGGCNWHGNTVNVNVWRNTTINNTHIDRNHYQRYYQGRGMVGPNGQGTWHHDASHRKGVAYRDPATAQRYGQSPRSRQPGRDARGYSERGRATQPLPAPGHVPGGGRERPGGTPGGATRAPGQAPPAATGGYDRRGAGGADRGAGGRVSGQGPKESTTGVRQEGRGQRGALPAAGRGGTRVEGGAVPAPSGGHDSAFSRSSGDGARTRAESDRGQSSRQFSGGGSGQSFGGVPAPRGGSGGAAPSGGSFGGGGRGGHGGGGGGGHGGGGGQGGGGGGQSGGGGFRR